jgi:hypothetical protein
MIQHVFRYVLLLAVGIVPVYFLQIDRKFELMIGWMVGATLSFIIGMIFIKRKKKKENHDI